jgi:hypothetical protein
MTYSDLESRSMSIIHLLEHRLMVGNFHAKLEGHSFILPSGVIVYNAKLGQLPLVTLKVGQGQ